MASKSKKPAKPIAGQSGTIVEDPNIVGLKIMYVGSKDAPSICVKCGKKTIRGMIRMRANTNYCSAGCVKADPIADGTE